MATANSCIQWAPVYYVWNEPYSPMTDLSVMYAKGDQLIHVNIWTPQHLSAEEKAALDKMGQSANFHPKPDKGEKGFFDRMREFFS